MVVDKVNDDFVYNLKARIDASFSLYYFLYIIPLISLHFYD